MTKCLALSSIFVFSSCVLFSERETRVNKEEGTRKPEQWRWVGYRVLAGMEVITGVKFGPQEINGNTGLKKNIDAGQTEEENVSTQQYIVFPLWSSISSSYKSSYDKAEDDIVDDDACKKTAQESTMDTNSIFGNAYDDHDLETLNTPYADQSVGAEADFNNMEPSTVVSPIPTTRVHSIHPKAQIIGDPKSAVQTRGMTKKNSREHAMISYIQKQRRTNHKDFQNCLFACFLSQHEPTKISQALDDESWVEAMQEELLQFKIQKINVKSAFLYGTIEEEVYVCQHPGFVDLEFPKKVYKVEKALHGLHQAPKV
ncbi:putative ribonuclease H-like domain-containing protein [Tanacetum coccineum]|uniref:Ribonuclease H-like domain-containing protein n=1 Tax=Tanacetum coccineum TaxID=301880 RepID=A0ABQ5IV14_9ASTR